MDYERFRDADGVERLAVRVEMDEADAEALAQFLKRCGWSDWRSNATSDAEACAMRSGCEQVARALARAGYAPR